MSREYPYSAQAVFKPLLNLDVDLTSSDPIHKERVEKAFFLFLSQLIRFSKAYSEFKPTEEQFGGITYFLMQGLENDQQKQIIARVLQSNAFKLFSNQLTTLSQMTAAPVWLAIDQAELQTVREIASILSHTVTGDYMPQVGMDRLSVLHHLAAEEKLSLSRREENVAAAVEQISPKTAETQFSSAQLTELVKLTHELEYSVADSIPHLLIPVFSQESSQADYWELFFNQLNQYLLKLRTGQFTSGLNDHNRQEKLREHLNKYFQNLIYMLAELSSGRLSTNEDFLTKLEESYPGLESDEIRAAFANIDRKGCALILNKLAVIANVGAQTDIASFARGLATQYVGCYELSNQGRTQANLERTSKRSDSCADEKLSVEINLTGTRITSKLMHILQVVTQTTLDKTKPELRIRTTAFQQACQDRITYLDAQETPSEEDLAEKARNSSMLDISFGACERNDEDEYRQKAANYIELKKAHDEGGAAAAETESMTSSSPSALSMRLKRSSRLSRWRARIGLGLAAVLVSLGVAALIALAIKAAPILAVTGFSIGMAYGISGGTLFAGLVTALSFRRVRNRLVRIGRNLGRRIDRGLAAVSSAFRTLFSAIRGALSADAAASSAAAQSAQGSNDEAARRGVAPAAASTQAPQTQAARSQEPFAAAASAAQEVPEQHRRQDDRVSAGALSALSVAAEPSQRAAAATAWMEEEEEDAELNLKALGL